MGDASQKGSTPTRRRGQKKVKMKFRWVAVLCVLAVLLSVTVVSGAAKYPSKPVNVIVFSSAGGGTDVMSRYLGAAMEKILDTKFIVSNMPGGLGGIAAEYVWQQSHDGYNILGVSETATTFLVNNATTHGIKDWSYFIAAGSPGVIAVKADSPYTTLESFIKAAKEKPKTLKISNSGTGKLWHIKAVIMQSQAQVEFMHVPYNGSNPAILSVLSGETDAVSAALGEVSEQVRAGKLRLLVITEDTRVKTAAFKSIPALTEKYRGAKKYFPLQQWLGFAVPKDTPAEVVKALTAAFDKVMRDPKTDEFCEKGYMTKLALRGAKAYDYAVKMESSISWISQQLGVAKVDPATLGIAKPEWAQ